MSQLKDMQNEVIEFCVEKGWKGPDAPVKTFGDCIALLHSEVSEALEAFRDHGLSDATDTRTTIGYTLPKPEGVGSEFADILIRLLDDCDRYDVDLEEEFHRKMQYNWTRSHRHGGKRL